MRLVRLAGEGWWHSPVVCAWSRYDRWRGLRGRSDSTALLIATSSVHGIGMKRAFLAVGITSHGVVDRIQTVEPGRVVSLAGCSYVLELPLDVTPPTLGTRLELAHV